MDRKFRVNIQGWYILMSIQAVGGIGLRLRWASERFATGFVRGSTNAPRGEFIRRSLEYVREGKTAQALEIGQDLGFPKVAT